MKIKKCEKKKNIYRIEFRDWGKQEVKKSARNGWPMDSAVHCIGHGWTVRTQKNVPYTSFFCVCGRVKVIWNRSNIHSGAGVGEHTTKAAPPRSPTQMQSGPRTARGREPSESLLSRSIIIHIRPGVYSPRRHCMKNSIRVCGTRKWLKNKRRNEKSGRPRTRKYSNNLVPRKI